MSEYNSMEPLQDESQEPQEPEEQKVHFFCKLTFGQFFTLMVLEVITLCFVFYLGARYGNEYLKLDVVTESKREPVSIVSSGTPSASQEGLSPEDAVLKQMAKKVLEGEKVDLKKRVEEILARQQGGTTPPVGEPAYGEYPPNTQIPAAAQDPDANTQVPSAQEAPQAPANEQATLEDEESPPTPSGPQQMRQYKSGDGSDDQAAQGAVKVKSGAELKFSVQIGSYPDVKEASYRVEEWKAKGYPAYMMIVNLADKGQWYRVRVGAFNNKEEAGRYLEGLTEKEGIKDAFVVKNEQ